MKPKVLCVLHRAPPAHGAAKVGDFIASSSKLAEGCDCRFISIKSSETIGEIGKVSFRKFYLVAELYFKVLWALLFFRPDKIYFTSSIRSVALYRDLLVSTLWKVYGRIKSVEVYYHYHTKGVSEYISGASRNKSLTKFFIKGVNLIVLSPLLEKDFDEVKVFKSISFLPNGVEDALASQDVKAYISDKYSDVETVEALYLAHMMRDKGYWDVLELALKTKGQNIRYHFAGSWKEEGSEKEFFDFVEKHQLGSQVIYHGYVSGTEKKALFKQSHILLYPSRNDAFPLTLLESLSFGVPVIATAEGSIPLILDEQCGIVLSDVSNLQEAFEISLNSLINEHTAEYARGRYLNHFTLETFEDNLVKVLSGK
ncbi:MAG: glycosyltransferase [Pseudomonadales bacterium]|nr:glycosyltransferase [Pseudomonadales bacterium]